MPRHNLTLQDQVTPFRLEPLAPIHVGSGELLDPMSYLIDEKGEQLHFIDLPAWVEDHPDPERLAAAFGSKPMGALRGLVRQELKPELYAFASAAIRSKKVVETYERELRNQKGQNQLFIDPALKNPLSGALVIPGSSIKGALRTPVIDYLDQKYELNLKGNPGKVEDNLKSVLGDIKDNSFKNLKVGDFEARVGHASIVTAQEMRIKAGEKKNVTPKNPCEVTKNLLMDGSPEPIYGKLLIGAHNAAQQDVVLSIKVVRDHDSWTLKELIALCKKFYGMRYLSEKKKFYDLPHFAEAKKQLAPLEQVLKNLNDTETLIRVGHYSHVECVTIENNEPQRRKLKNGTLLPCGTTRTLADGRFPFGWAKLSVCDWEEYQDALADKRRHDESMAREREEKRATVRRQAVERLRQRAEMERLKAAREAEEARKREEEARERQQLEAMPPEERLIWELELGRLDQSSIGLKFPELMKLEGEYQKRAAKALKQLWIKSGDWDVKPKKKKQYDKVQMVKKILGE